MINQIKHILQMPKMENNFLKKISSKNILTLSCIFFLFFCNSCTRSILSKYGLFDEQVLLKKVSNNKKSIIFMPMHHVGKPTFYADVRYKIDSLQKADYFVFFEGLSKGFDINSKDYDTAQRKIRKVLGLVTSQIKDGYLDTASGTLAGIKFNFLKGLVNQPKGYKLGIDSTKAKNVDLSFKQLIQLHEEKYGIINLDECDLNNKLSDKYSCRKLKNKNAKIDMMENYRNENIVNEIIASPNRNILIIYGSKHVKAIIQLLQQKDASWIEN